jgi:hypothetical protein
MVTIPFGTTAIGALLGGLGTGLLLLRRQRL